MIDFGRRLGGEQWVAHDVQAISRYAVADQDLGFGVPPERHVVHRVVHLVDLGP
jgi:hypothetical protein